MTYDQFALTVRSHGLSPHRCGDDHWQIHGGTLLVNYYETTGKIYVNGTTKAFVGTLAEAIIAARKPPGVTVKRADDLTKAMRKFLRETLLSTNPYCFKCGKKLNITSATLDHIIPRSRGGSNGLDNLRLACQPCNEKRGNNVSDLVQKRPETPIEMYEWI